MRYVGLLVASMMLLAPTMVWAKPLVVYVMRHLHTPQGSTDPDLTSVGRQHALLLDRWFRGKRLKAIYISNYRRTRQTVTPLVARLGLEPKVYDPADSAALVVNVGQETGPVLIVGHSNTVPDLVEQLGGSRPAPLSHPDFGDIWTVRRGTVKREQIKPR